MLTEVSFAVFRAVSLKQTLVTLLFLAGALPLFAQNNISINATGAAAHPSAILDVTSTTSGMLFPRMTEAERNAIASPVNGLVIFQTDGDEGFWYWDAGAAVPYWRKMPRFLGANVEMGPAPSTIINGSGFSVTRLITGTDQIDFNVPFANVPNVIVTSSYALGQAPELSEYCDVSFNSCECHHIRDFRLWSGMTVGAGNLLIDNLGSDCNDQPGRTIFYPPGDPVYVHPTTDVCLTTSSFFSLAVRGNNPSTANPSPCGTHSIKTYIDWQQDGFYDEMEDRVQQQNAFDWSLAGPGPVNYDIRPIPAGLPPFNGETFMRVLATPSNIINSCPGGNVGEHEIYVVTVSCGTTPVYDDVPSYCNVGDFTNAAYRISCRRLGGEPRNVKNYYFQVHENP